MLNAIKPGHRTPERSTSRTGATSPPPSRWRQVNLANTPASIRRFRASSTLQVKDLGDPACTVSCPAPVTVYSGTLGSMGTLALGTFAAGATHHYTFSVTFPDGGSNGADNAYGGAATTSGLPVDGHAM